MAAGDHSELVLAVAVGGAEGGSYPHQGRQACRHYAPPATPVQGPPHSQDLKTSFFIFNTVVDSQQNQPVFICVRGEVLLLHITTSNICVCRM
jgi:hypothetical protein